MEGEKRFKLTAARGPGHSCWHLTADYWQLPWNSSCGPVVYATIPVGPGSKEQLADRLMQGLASQVSAGINTWEGMPFQLDHSPLGQPSLRQGGARSLAISFSLAGEKLWGALTGAGRVGIDAACAREFPRDYPWQRVFTRQEFGRAGALCRGDSALAAALLWSLKEAAVKALGVGFNYLSPREIGTGEGKPWKGGLLFEVEAGCPVKTWARPAAGGWVALALGE